MSVLLAVSGALEVDILNHLASAHPPIPVARRCADSAELLGAARAGLGHIAIVADADVMLVADLHAAGVRVIAANAEAHARERGVDAVCSPHGADVAATVASLMDAPRIEPNTLAAPLRRAGGIIAIWGTGGAPGRSTLARDLAAAFAGQGEGARRWPWRRAGEPRCSGAHTLLIDADTAYPSLAQLLAMRHESSAIAAVARKINREGSAGAAIAEACAPCAGFDFLTGLNTGARWRELPEPIIRSICGEARARWDITVADCAPGAEIHEYGGAATRDSATLTLLDEADIVLCAVKASPLGVRRLLALLDEPAAQQVENLHIVITHAPRAASAERRHAIATILAEKKYEVSAWISRDDARYAQAERMGQSLLEFAGESAPAREVAELACRLAELLESRGSAQGEAPSSAGIACRHVAPAA